MTYTGAASIYRERASKTGVSGEAVQGDPSLSNWVHDLGTRLAHWRPAHSLVRESEHCDTHVKVAEGRGEDALGEGRGRARSL